MTQETTRLFRRLDRAFWLIWLAFPAVLFAEAVAIRRQDETLAAVAPQAAACLADLPQVDRFSAAGQAVFWSLFAAQALVYALLLGLAHRVIRRCAAGEIFVAEVMRTMRAIGLIITALPIALLALDSAALAALVALGDLHAFSPSLDLDLPTLGAGLLFLTLAAAMRQAMALREDADLTI